ncbi:MAG TPA: efflux RND transporter periplasmic adaptor subunit, partial [Prosthecobacter sp.]|nr:efflux RND transporter periplasmic adaptor subunit [Prosthecobacter sp.]
MPRYLRLTGEITAAQDAAVAADTTGKVTETPVERGSVVQLGDILVQLDNRAAALSLAEAEANVIQAKSKLALAESEVTRNAPLARMKAVADTEFARIKADRDAGAASLAAAEARRDMAKKSLDDTSIRAPFAGTVAERLVAKGEYVRTDSQVARLVDLQNLRLVVNVAEPDVGSVREGQTVEFSVSSYPGETFTGTVKFIGAAMREGSRDLLVEAEVKNPGGKLKPGLFAEARLVLAEQKAVTIPIAALRTDGSRRKVWVVEKDQLSERLVEVGETRNGRVEIRRGVEKGENVVLSPGADATDGMPVKATAQL